MSCIYDRLSNITIFAFILFPATETIPKLLEGINSIQTKKLLTHLLSPVSFY